MGQRKMSLYLLVFLELY